MIQFIEYIIVSENVSISRKHINLIQEMFHSDLRSMINFIQLHQINIDEQMFNSFLWEELHQLFLSRKSEIVYFEWFLINKIYPTNINLWIKNYFRFMIRNHIEYINSDFLNIAENIVHTNDINSEILLSYFIHQMCFFFNKLLSRKIEKLT